MAQVWCNLKKKYRFCAAMHFGAKCAIYAALETLVNVFYHYNSKTYNKNSKCGILHCIIYTRYLKLFMRVGHSLCTGEHKTILIHCGLRNFLVSAFLDILITKYNGINIHYCRPWSKTYNEPNMLWAISYDIHKIYNLSQANTKKSG